MALKIGKKEGLGTVGRAYRSALNWSLNHKWIVLIVSIFILVGSVVIGARNLGTSYISTGDNKFLALTYTPKPGETQKSVTQHAEKVQNYLDKKIK